MQGDPSTQTVPPPSSPFHTQGRCGREGAGAPQCSLWAPGLLLLSLLFSLFRKDPAPPSALEATRTGARESSSPAFHKQQGQNHPISTVLQVHKQNAQTLSPRGRFLVVEVVEGPVCLIQLVQDRGAPCSPPQRAP